MSDYIVGTRVWVIEDSTVGSVTEVISGNVYRVKWDTPLGNGHIDGGVYSKDWLDVKCVVSAVLPEEEKGKDIKDPRTWVKVVKTVDTPLTACPFCGSYNQELMGTVVKCRGCSARADIEDWNKRTVGEWDDRI